MPDETRRPCPFCAEAILPDAIRCPHCRSRLVALDPAGWRRDHPERRVAGVAAALAHALAVPVGLVRAGFILLTFVHFVGVLAYAALWAVVPLTPGSPTPAERAVTVARETIDRFWHGRRDDAPTPTGPVA
jgi:phage shock protein PspC (stress-responsive transcriptional regulator)